MATSCTLDTRDGAPGEVAVSEAGKGRAELSFVAGLLCSGCCHSDVTTCRAFIHSSSAGRAGPVATELGWWPQGSAGACGAVPEEGTCRAHRGCPSSLTAELPGPLGSAEDARALRARRALQVLPLTITMSNSLSVL